MEVVPTVGASGGEEKEEEEEEEEEGAADTSGLLPAAQTVTARLSTGAELRAIQTFTTNTRSVNTKAPTPWSSPLPPAVILEGRGAK